MAAQAVLIGETIAGMKKAIARRDSGKFYPYACRVNPLTLLAQPPTRMNPSVNLPIGVTSSRERPGMFARVNWILQTAQEYIDV